jgi:hypothetical protein
MRPAEAAAFDQQLTLPSTGLTVAVRRATSDNYQSTIIEEDEG